MLENLDNIDDIKNAIKEAQIKSQGLKFEILKHYLLNYLLYKKLPENEKNNSPIINRLKECTILYKKLLEIEKYDLSNIDDEVIKKKIKYNFTKNKKKTYKNSKTKYRIKFNKQNENIKNEVSTIKKKVKKFK